MFHIASVFIWMLYMFCNDFSSFFMCFCMCFRWFQVFHLSLDVCCKYFFWMFQKYIECCTCLQWCWWLATTFPLSVNSLTIATALSWVTSSFGARPPRTAQSKGMVARPPKMTQSRGMVARVREAEGTRASEWLARRQRRFT
jgi:hypothetical protein